MACALSTTDSHAADAWNGKDKPLWELGAVGIGTYLPDYPGSDQNHARGMVFPWVAYRGKILRAGDKGMVRARMFKTDRVEFDLSLDGALPVSSEDNTARRGMTDLDWMGEIGPRLEINILKTQAGERSARIDFDLPVRAAFSTAFKDFDIQQRGYVFSPALLYKNKNLSHSGLNLDLRAEAVFASQDYMDYFYTVTPPYVTATRAAYQAEGGYLGSRLRLTVEHPWTERLTTYVHGRAESFLGATNADSPLHRADSSFGFGFGLRYALFQSDQKAR